MIYALNSKLLWQRMVQANPPSPSPCESRAAGPSKTTAGITGAPGSASQA